MSVETPRHAAAQRTAAATRRARAFRLASWLLIVPTLALFSFTVVAGASGYGSKGNYEDAVKQVVVAAPDGKGALVVVRASSPNGNPVEKLFSGSLNEVCWITQSQLTRVQQRYATGWMTIKVQGKPVSLVTVGGANERDLRTLLAARALTCRLVQAQRTFFLPFDAHGS